MSKKLPLSQTNPYLRDPAERRYWVLTTVISSAAIEGIHLSKEDLEILLRKPGPVMKSRPNPQPPRKQTYGKGGRAKMAPHNHLINKDKVGAP